MLKLKDNIKEFKRKRYELISREEEDFVKSIGIAYNGTDRYDNTNNNRYISITYF